MNQILKNKKVILFSLLAILVIVLGILFIVNHSSNKRRDELVRLGLELHYDGSDISDFTITKIISYRYDFNHYTLIEYDINNHSEGSPTKSSFKMFEKENKILYKAYEADGYGLELSKKFDNIVEKSKKIKVWTKDEIRNIMKEVSVKNEKNKKNINTSYSI